MNIENTKIAYEGISKKLETIDSDNYNEVYDLILATGLRVGEVLALTWDDIDLDAGKLSVNKTFVGASVHKPKTGVHDVLLPPDVIEMLRRHKTSQEQYKQAYGCIYQDRGLVFCASTGNMLNRTLLSSNLKRLAIANIPGSTNSHSIRHAYLLTKGGGGNG